METHKIEGSSWIESIGVDRDKGIIVGQFRTGTYQYSNVPNNIFTGLLAAESKGKYFNANILNADYPYERLS